MTAAVVLLHTVAAAASLIADIPPLLKATALTGVVLSLGYNLRREKQTRKLIWREGNQWSIESTNSAPADARLHSVDFLSRWLVIITLQPEFGRKLRLLIPFDSVSKDSYRLLRVRLRIEGHSLINPTH